ncbi:hypothetical protein GCM10009839_22070 [Catenulispora yoronensis]|uniref:Uncharacterized protein n=1 Tax=Catenulispora yoronensis TaxID=450799 RepID=A0ABN2TYC1_9ACTN
MIQRKNQKIIQNAFSSGWSIGAAPLSSSKPPLKTEARSERRDARAVRGIRVDQRKPQTRAAYAAVSVRGGGADEFPGVLMDRVADRDENAR